MEYIVNLYSEDEITSECKFHIQQEAFIHIGRIVTNALFPIKIEVERKYLVKAGIEELTTIVYHLYEAE